MDNEAAKIDSHGLTHVGIVREDNQDSIQLPKATDPRDTHGELYAVADGMGGYTHGGLASSIALKTLYETFYAEKPGNTPAALRSGVQSANLNIFKAAQKLGVSRMGTTLTAAHLSDDSLTIAHVGDSRIYLIRDGVSKCLTNDHSQVGEMVRMRILAPDKLRTHANRSILNRCLGLELFVQPDIVQISVQPDDRLILCTDGVWAVIEDDEFADLAVRTPDVDTLSGAILDLAMKRETDDNISVIAVHIREVTVNGREPRRGLLRRVFSARS
ncbi:MAG TPA: protein phosphatase 2C domain-containing protein [Aggregatilineales bacterium]|nr:protein phosphatase 2C domain-containing protein [Aggregatilineales bacterium]